MRCNLFLQGVDNIAKKVDLHHREGRQGVLNIVPLNAISYFRQGNMGLPDKTFKQRRVICEPRRTEKKTSEERSK